MSKAHEIAEKIMVSDPQWTDDTVRRWCQDDLDLTQEVIMILKLQDSGQLILDQLQSRFGRKPAFDFETNERFGEYVLISFIGRGGFGEVWLARKESESIQETDDTPANVVLKISNDRSDLDLEINALEQVNSIDGVAKLLDHGQVNGIPFVVMEHVPGQTLATLLVDPSWPSSVDEAKSCVVELARILADIHSIRSGSDSSDEVGTMDGLAHGDVTPSNIIIRNGQPILIDFGTSFQKHRYGNADELPAIPSRPLSFTPNYRVPEVVYGIGATTAADVYQVGLIGYEIISGEKFTTDREQDKQEEGFEAIAEKAGESFAAIIRKCLSWDPNDRFSNAIELRSALTGNRLEARSGLPTKIAVMTLSAMVLVTIMVVFWFNRPPKNSSANQQEIAVDNSNTAIPTKAKPEVVWSDDLRENFDAIILPFWWDATNFDLSEIYAGAGFAGQKRAEFEQLIEFCEEWIDRHPVGFPRIQNEIRWTRNWLKEMLHVAPLAVAFDRKNYDVPEASVRILVNGKSVYDEKLVNLPQEPVIPLDCRIFDVVEVKLLIQGETVATDHFVYLMAYNVGMKPNGLRFSLSSDDELFRLTGAVIATSRMAPPVLPTRAPPHRVNHAGKKRMPEKK